MMAFSGLALLSPTVQISDPYPAVWWTWPCLGGAPVKSGQQEPPCVHLTSMYFFKHALYVKKINN